MVFKRLAYTLNVLCHVTKTITKSESFVKALPMINQSIESTESKHDVCVSHGLCKLDVILILSETLSTFLDNPKEVGSSKLEKEAERG